MRVVTLNDIPHEDLGEATPIAGWTGGSVTRTRQTIIPDGGSDNYKCSIVNFSLGSTTGWHAHDCDQILVVTSGSGKVATESEAFDLNVGDVVHIKAGERHWHGAKAETTMGHITITMAGSASTR
jgi:quercetin dioxygenase-like cupin family protein